MDSWALTEPSEVLLVLWLFVGHSFLDDNGMMSFLQHLRSNPGAWCTATMANKQQLCHTFDWWIDAGHNISVVRNSLPDIFSHSLPTKDFRSEVSLSYFLYQGSSIFLLSLGQSKVPNLLCACSRRGSGVSGTGNGSKELLLR